jgi:hypothetical protein
VKFCQNDKLKIEILSKSNQSPEVGKRKEKEKSTDSYIWFSLFSQKIKRMIKDLRFISGL